MAPTEAMDLNDGAAELRKPHVATTTRVGSAALALAATVFGGLQLWAGRDHLHERRLLA